MCPAHHDDTLFQAEMRMCVGYSRWKTGMATSTSVSRFGFGLPLIGGLPGRPLADCCAGTPVTFERYL